MKGVIIEKDGYYKIVSKRYGCLLSTAYPYLPVDWVVYYKEGEWHCGYHNTPLFVYRFQADSIVNTDSIDEWNEELWLVEVINPQPADRVASLTFSGSNDLYTWWTKRSEYKGSIWDAPLRTHAVDGLRLVERIYPL